MYFPFIISTSGIKSKYRCISFTGFFYQAKRKRSLELLSGLKSEYVFSNDKKYEEFK